MFGGMRLSKSPYYFYPALVWIVDAGGIGVVIGYLLVALSFLKLRKAAPDLKRPYKIKNGKAKGVIAIILSLSFIIIYLPGMPSSLIWPSEWLIVFVWYGIAAILYYIQKRKNKVIENDKIRSFEPSNE